MAIIISDDFNRADSNTVGGSWTEVGASATAERILSNQLRIEYAGGGNAGVSQNHGDLTLPVSFSFKSVHGSGTSRQYYALAYSDASTNGYGIRWQAGTSGSNNSIVIPGNVSALSFTADFTGTKYIWIDLYPNGSNVDILVYISSTTTKPASPTKILVNQTLTTTNKNLSIYNDAPASGDYSDFDDVILQSFTIETLRPTGVGDETNISNVTGASTHWEAVDETVADDGTTVVYHNTDSTSARDLYALANSSVGAGTINKITVFVRGEGTTAWFKSAIKEGGTVTESAQFSSSADDTFETKSTDYLVNPRTGSAWQWSEINDLQVGVVSYRDPGQQGRITQVYVVVDYIAPVEVGITKSLKYTILTSTAIQKSLNYKVLSNTAIQKSIKYSVLTTPSAKTKSLQYLVQKIINTTKSLSYFVKTNVDLQKSLKYTVLTTPTPMTKSVMYLILTSNLIQKTLQYLVKSSIVVQKSLKYVVFSPVAVSKSLKYTVVTTQTPIIKSLQYYIVKSISATKSLQYLVMFSVSKTKSLKYTVTTTVSPLTKSLEYTILIVTGITKTLKYLVKVSITTQKSLKYTVITGVPITKSLKYAVLCCSIVNTKSLVYKTVHSVTIQKSLKYEVMFDPYQKTNDLYTPL